MAIAGGASDTRGEQQIKFVTCLAVDMIGSTEMYLKLPTLQQQHFNLALVRQITPHLENLGLGGAVLKFTGDGWLIMSDEPSDTDALMCFATIMRDRFGDEMAELTGLPREIVPPLRLAIGFGRDMGVSLPDGSTDWVGDSVRRAVRLSGYCYPNEVLVLESVAANARDFTFEVQRLDARAAPYRPKRDEEGLSAWRLLKLRDIEGNWQQPATFAYMLGVLGRDQDARQVINHAAAANSLDEFARLLTIAPDAHLAEQLVREARNRGVALDTATYNALLRRLSYTQATRWLEQMVAEGVAPDVETYTTFLCKSKSLEVAVQWLHRMHREHIRPHSTSYRCLIVKTKSYDQACTWMERAASDDVTPDVMSYNTVMGRAPSYSAAVKWFNKLRVDGLTPNVITYTTLISKSGSYSAACSWLDEITASGIAPSVVTYVSLISHAPSYEEALRWITQMQAEGLPVGVHAYTALIAKAPLAEALRWLEVLQRGDEPPNAVTYNTIMKKEESYDATLQWLVTMRQRGVEPNIVSYTTAISKAPTYDEAITLFQFMSANGIAPNEFTFNAMIAQAPMYDAAQEWLDEMKRAGFSPGAKTYRAVATVPVSRPAHGAGPAGSPVATDVPQNRGPQNSPRYDSALVHYERRRAKGLEPNPATLMTLVARARTYRDACAWMERIPRDGLDLTRATYNAIIARAPDVAESRRWMTAMAADGFPPDVVAYTTLMGKVKSWREARLVVDEMRGHGVEPTEITYNAVVSTTTSEAEAFDAVDWLRSEGVEPSTVCYNTIVARTATYEAAVDCYRRLEERGFRPDAVTYNTLIAKAPSFSEGRRWLAQMVAGGFRATRATLSPLFQKDLSSVPANELLALLALERRGDFAPLNAAFVSYVRSGALEDAILLAVRHPELTAVRKFMRETSTTALNLLGQYAHQHPDDSDVSLATAIALIEARCPAEARPHLYRALAGARHQDDRRRAEKWLARAEPPSLTPSHV